ncbi:dihydrofolate reductase family protein [Tomitella fengzijianii]|uniref:Dihydrofolate reductase n=1 Tax=Tomitella fengzijianii TaxID=2597660 RepID=A0A516WZR1_9ACTN|nr:dihydrofolate reductase family protein [Tomitella fengzijianii]QDQ96270.1 dihydrofolate reductase [Tomitella fengzijianii]
MSRTRYYTASSLDGYIATDDHSLAWLLSRDIDDDGPMNHGEFMAGIGAVAMGASSFNWIRGQLGQDEWPYAVPCWIFTHGSAEPPAPGSLPDADLRFVQGDVAAVHAEMVTAAGDADVWIVGGGDLAGQFADAGLLDEVNVQIAPVTLGSGAPLLPRHLELRLAAQDRNGEFACLRFDVV